MRIIAGVARGRKIFSVSEKLPVKPISDRIKQSVFDIIKPRIPGSHMLDLFAGTGNVGLEALSRGAQRVVFVEREGACLKAITRNLENLGFTDKGKTLKADILEGVTWVKRHCTEEGFDLIFMGPPYRDKANKPLYFTQRTLDSVAEGELLAETGLIVAQHHQNEKFTAPKGLECFREEKYGDTIVSFLRRVKPA